jgi:tRNA A-37 threonylcarbamoyl transferase component Bud32
VAFVEINPRYGSLLAQEGLTTPDALLALPSIIISGHPDRNVARVRIGSGRQAVAAILKREHRVPWKERLANAWEGFGFVSKSQREAVTLRAVREAKIHCPDWIAVGEDRSGRTFLLLRDLQDCIDLRAYLWKTSEKSRREQHLFAKSLGRLLARLHDAGFSHGDLYSKHVYVDPQSRTIHIIDWQRAGRRRIVPWRMRCRDLVTLAATLDKALAEPRWRLACLAAYLRATKAFRSGRRISLAVIARRVVRRETKLLRRRRIWEMQQVAPASPKQNVIWRDEEALCVTEEFDVMLGEGDPDWLTYERMPPRGRNLELGAVCPCWLPSARLIFRRETRVWAGLATWIRGKKLISSSVRQAGQILRLQRLGLQTQRLVAFGQRQVKPWCVESFILTQAPAHSHLSSLGTSGVESLDRVCRPDARKPAPVHG